MWSHFSNVDYFNTEHTVNEINEIKKNWFFNFISHSCAN